MKKALTTLKHASLITGAYLAATLLLAASVFHTYVEAGNGLA